MKNENITIREVQLKCIEIMDYFVDVCEKHSLRYYIAGGTLLGAVRHKGFIPWDDDIDIAMPRPDFERLLNLSHEMAEPYYLRHNRLSDEHYNYMFAKLENQGTCKIEEDCGKKYIGGISIDIFPQDGLPSNEIARKKLMHKFTYYKLMRDYNSINASGMKQWGYKVFSIILKSIKRIASYDDELDRICSQYNYDTSEYARSFYGVYGDKETYLRKLFGKGYYLEFEGRMFCAPEKWDDYLIQMYGDYMTLPPAEKRATTHNLENVSLNTSYRALR